MTDKVKIYVVRNDDGEYLMDPSSAAWLPDWIDDVTSADLYEHKEEAEEAAAECDGHVVELVEAPAKAVVSEEEAEMLEQAKNMLNPMHVLWMNELTHNGDSDGQNRLMRAYVNGWTVEKPKRWYVKVPHATNSYYYDMGWGNGLETQDMKAGTQPLPGFREAQFTQDEINKRCLQHCERVEATDDDE